MTSINLPSSSKDLNQKFSSLPTAKLDRMAHAAVEAKQVAYCPYSKFRVGCALLTESEMIITGANVENASYPVGMCAEACAVGKAVKIQYLVTKIGIYKGGIADGFGHLDGRPYTYRSHCGINGYLASRDIITSLNSRTASPCGKCRQFIREFSHPSIPIFMYDKHGEFVVRTLEELLPMSFGPEDLQAR